MTDNKRLNVGKDAVVMGDVSGNVGDGSVVIRATDNQGNVVLNRPMAVGRNAHAGPGSIAIGAGAGAGMPSAGGKVVSILFLAADPTNCSRLRLGQEFREIDAELNRAPWRDRFRLERPQLAVRPADISRALLDLKPQIVHFSGHGTSTGELCFENQVGETQLVQPDALAQLFKQFALQVNCVLLNACYSEIQAEAIAKHIEYVIGMNQALKDQAAIAFAIGFYQALGAGRTIEEAYELGRVQIGLQGIPEHLTPVLIKREQTQP